MSYRFDLLAKEDADHRTDEHQQTQSQKALKLGIEKAVNDIAYDHELETEQDIGAQKQPDVADAGEPIMRPRSVP